MLKEIFEQPQAVAATLEGRVHAGRLLEGCFGAEAEALLDVEVTAEEVQALSAGQRESLLLVSLALAWVDEEGGILYFIAADETEVGELIRSSVGLG